MTLQSPEDHSRNGLARVMNEIEIRSEVQKNPVADEVSALIAVVRPILAGLLYALKQDVVREVGAISGRFLGSHDLVPSWRRLRVARY
jgi:hypothetical protein